ncbi:hypothetical protein M1K46_05680 [Fictibacillus sp. WQ 8-8]|uniref:Uncharacterized protein n=1 Tax=Fictibacillus marinisediminis TaxID=2878389 RepID=A0A9X1XEZ1_9BACL|nr:MULTISPECIES: hypothetical protein [Fictibacillus]MCK6256364.1 hypothetical protein [Fictibacillus marinisediminis]MCQ6265153.1 hypothetical protein [Fictibacillus sp. WQ 8-8]UZJ77742.1 hypothetical protein OKX00_16440 [Fictibacillus sp. KU28468]
MKSRRFVSRIQGPKPTLSHFEKALKEENHSILTLLNSLKKKRWTFFAGK